MEGNVEAPPPTRAPTGGYTRVQLPNFRQLKGSNEFYKSMSVIYALPNIRVLCTHLQVYEDTYSENNHCEPKIEYSGIAN